MSLSALLFLIDCEIFEKMTVQCVCIVRRVRFTEADKNKIRNQRKAVQKGALPILKAL